MKNYFIKNIIRSASLSLAAIAVAFNVSASNSDADTYLKSCERKNSAALLSALNEVIDSHTAASYDGLYEWFLHTDVHPDGQIWDMYSTKKWGTSFSKIKCGSYSNVGDCINREHSFPKSWFNDARPMYTDVFHLYPTDGKVNGQRSNYPYGECENGTRLSSSNGAEALGRLGKSTFSGYSGTVFEPDDEYKGDFARTYFYMAACYNDKIKSWNSDMLAGNSYPAFKTWAVSLLLKWHREDPVSQKEIDRNNAAYKLQKNRNPFIDHPELAEYVWGNKTSQAWTIDADKDPVISAPADGSHIDLGTTGIGCTLTRLINVKGSGLKENVNIALSGATFSCANTSISPVNGEVNTVISVEFKSQTAGTFNGGIVFTSGGAITSVTLVATSADGLPVLPASNVTTESFLANWVYVGDEIDSEFYKLTVSDVSGVLDGYPMLVDAGSENHSVSGLQPSTTYFYSLQSTSMTSQTVTVTTAALLPSIQILTDDDELALSAQPGEPSEIVELLLDIENISENITLHVDSPFHLSIDKREWSETLVIDPREDRCYLRMLGTEEGVFTSTITARVGDYLSDDATVTGVIGVASSFVEDFERYDEPENNGVSNYNSNFTYTGETHSWIFNQAGIWESDKGMAQNGSGVVRFSKQPTSNIYMDSDITSGVGSVTFYARKWSESEANASVALEYSVDGGVTWVDCGTKQITTATMTPCEFVVNQAGNVRLKIQQHEGARMLVDYVTATPYNTGVETIVGDEYRTWDAWVVDAEVHVTIPNAGKLAIHNAVTGITHIETDAPRGESIYMLPQGHYIVAYGTTARRVVVR